MRLEMFAERIATKPITFAIDGDPQRQVYTAVRIARRWNGWAVPVVTRETVRAMLQDLDTDESGNAPEYRTAWVELANGSFMVEGPDDEEPTFLAPDAQGLYTFDLGWVLDTIDVDA